MIVKSRELSRGILLFDSRFSIFRFSILDFSIHQKHAYQTAHDIIDMAGSFSRVGERTLPARGLYSPTPMNHVLIGTADMIDRLLDLAEKNFLLIDDGRVADAFLSECHARLFDIEKHSFNPLKGIDYKRARDFASALYTANPEGAHTLTVRNGKRALVRLLLMHPTRLDRLPTGSKDPGDIEAVATVEDMLLSPVLRRVLCHSNNHAFPKGPTVLKLDRAKIGDFDAFLLAALAIGQHKGQIIVPDFGFYGRDFYVSLIRQNRLLAGVRYLAELSPSLQQLLLSIKDIQGHEAVFDDAEVLARYAGFAPGTQGFADYVHKLTVPQEPPLR